MHTNLFIPYNYICEAASLLIAGILLFVMLYTKPRKTFVYKYNFLGIICSIIAILLQMSIVSVANNPDRYYNRNLFMLQLLAFLLVYNAILFYIFAYVNMMSLARRNQRKEFMIMYLVLSILYVVGALIEIASRGLYSFEMNGIDICHFTRFYSAAGIICAVICFNATLSNKRHIARVVWHTVCVLVPIEIILLAAQIWLISTKHIVLSSTTYVPIFTLTYLMFHNVPYDEVSGCQSENALDTYLLKNLCRKKFYLVYVSFVMPTIDNMVSDGDDVLLKGAAACRAIEGISPHVKLFRVADDKFANVIETADEADFQKYVSQIRGVFDGVKAELKVPFNYIMIAGEVKPDLDTPIKVRQFFQFVEKRFSDQNSSHFYMTKPSDYDKFDESYNITVALKDIRNRLDLDDDRIMVYAQPIYSVQAGAFRVAEALMRLRIDGRVYSPDKFIPIAEESGCVHALTCIILNKVCRAIQELEDYYDFDAISINCSSKELSQPDMHSDLIGIIENYEIDVTKIRLEITESAMFENFEMANFNMNALSQTGIQFLLDDFGTGYSSLERVMNCPFNTIKFDKALLYKSLDDNRMDDIMTHMIEMFKKNGFVTLVEGVEDESQSQYSMDKGFEYIQGYHYAKPAPILELKKYFNRKGSF